MRDSWEVVELGSVLKKIVGGGTPSKKRPDYWNGTIPWCSVKDMDDDKFKISETKDSITEIGLNNSSSKLIKAETVITSTRMGLGKAFVTKIDMAINQDLKALIPNEKIDNYFLLWTIIAQRGNLLNLGTGSTVKGIRLGTLRNLKINLPPLPIQRKIAGVLSAYDELIANNLQRIKLLEEQAQLTYEEWFVRMKFPGHDKAVFDKETGLPDGWGKVNVGSIIKRVSSTTKIKASERLNSGKIPVVDQSRDFISGATNDKTALVNENLPLIIFGDHTRILKLINFPFARGADGTQVLLSKIKRMPQHLFYHTLLKIDLSDYHYARHFKFLKEKEIIIPTEKIAEKFEKIAEKIFAIRLNLQNQNESLKEARDLLLPRLMMGLVDVDELINDNGDYEIKDNELGIAAEETSNYKS